jgi:hypothetical protein
MYFCHMLILSGFGSGIRFPIYIFTYPLVYPLLAAFLTWNNSRLWLTDAILVNAVPFLYWYLLLWSDGKFSFHAALSWQTSSVMLLIIPVTIGPTLAVGFIVSRRRENPHTPTASDRGE